MTEEQSSEKSFLDNMSAKINEFNQRVNESKAGQDLKKIYFDINEELNKIGKKTSDTLDQQSIKMKKNLENLRNKIAKKLETEDNTS